MRKLGTGEQIGALYGAYFFITLYYSENLFGEPNSDLYRAFLQVIPSQKAWMLFGLSITLFYVVSMIWQHHIVIMFVNVLSGLFFTLIAVTYLFTYPNIGLALYTLVGFKNFQFVFRVSNEHEKHKTDKLKMKMKSKGSLHDYEKEDNNE
ncbi:hypothetical protein [Mammaliicoccus vitulinus]|uniref:hypothetical protein n=1 Tax=Mammaliicoccus vitulinus TaxID=71237 RepID=UPI0039AE96E0